MPSDKDPAPQTLRFQKATADQAEAVAEIIRQSFAGAGAALGVTREKFPNYVEFETAEAVAKRIGLGEHVVLAYLGQEPVGTVAYVCLPNRPKVGQISRLAVLPGHRGKGYGRQLMAHAEASLRQLGTGLVSLSLAAAHERLRMFYEELGYLTCEISRPHSLPFDVLNMEKPLPL